MSASDSAREKRITRGGTHRRARVGVGKPHSLRGQPVDARRGDAAALGIVAAYVTVAKIVRKDDVRALPLESPAVRDTIQQGREHETRQTARSFNA